MDREFVNIIESKFVATIFALRHIGRSENIIPQRKADAKVDPWHLTFRKMLHVMEKVHNRIVENVLERPPSDADIGVVEMPDSNGNEMHKKCLFRFKSTDEHHGQRLERFVQNVFHPMVSEVRCKPHFLNRMMYLMEPP